MPDLVDQLLSRPELQREGASSDRDIAEIEQRFGLTIPSSLRRIWEAGSSIAIDSLDAHWVCPTEILRFINDSKWPLDEYGFLPLIDTHQSNYVVWLTYAPLAPRIAWMPHDDEMRLLYRDFDRFLEEFLVALECADDAEDLYHHAMGDYGATAPRSADDRQDATRLLAAPGENFERNFACQLLDEHAIDEWEKLLETDHFVRRDVLRRLQQMDSPKITALLNRDRAAFESFSAEFAKAARDAGFEVGEMRNGCLRVNGKWFVLEAYFWRRHCPNAIARMMNVIRDQRENRDPRERPDFIFKDV